MLIRTYYGVSRNMLLRFKDDSIDETNNLVQLLQVRPGRARAAGLGAAVKPCAAAACPPTSRNPMYRAVPDFSCIALYTFSSLRQDR